MLYAFDCLMIFLGETVRMEDLDFAKEALKYKVPFAFVRSKADVNLNERVADGSSLMEAKADFLADSSFLF